jgi:hypothetical protein
MSTWVVGDIHGCADELRELLAELALAPGDALVAVGDLFHRGPDACGVMDVLGACGAHFVLGNHERSVLARAGLAPRRADGADRPARREAFPPLALDDLAGDGRRALQAPAERLGDLLRFLQGHSGFRVGPDGIPGAGRTPDGRAWWVVHAGITPGVPPQEARVEDLLYPARAAERGKKLWFDAYAGPDLVLYGHLPAREPRERRSAGRLVSLGLDTGCVYGGRLSAYSPERDELRSVPARRAYA